MNELSKRDRLIRAVKAPAGLNKPYFGGRASARMCKLLGITYGEDDLVRALRTAPEATVLTCWEHFEQMVVNMEKFYGWNDPDRGVVVELVTDGLNSVYGYLDRYADRKGFEEWVLEAAREWVAACYTEDEDTP